MKTPEQIRERNRNAMRKWRKKNRNRMLAAWAERMQRWRKKNRKKRNAYARQCHQKNREKINSRRRQLRGADPEKYRLRDRDRYYRDPRRRECHRKDREGYERVLAANKRWRKSAKGRTWWSAYTYYRNALRRAAKQRSNLTKADRAALREFYRWLKTAKVIPCRWCGRQTRPGKRHGDHVVPICRGGQHRVENLCCACPSCNSSKRHLMPEEFLRRLRGKFGG